MSDLRPWSEPEGRLLAALLDEIVPASADGRVPAAGALGVTEFLAGRAADDPELATLLRLLLTRAEALSALHGARFETLDAAGRVAIVGALEQEAPDAFTALLWHTYMGYYGAARTFVRTSASPPGRRSRRATSCPRTTPMSLRTCWPRCVRGAAAIARPERVRSPA